jgi:hypothetical protein
LPEGRIYLVGDETAYECKNGCQIITVVGKPGVEAWHGRGYRLKNYVIRNTRDIILNINPNVPDVLIPASPAALKNRR